MKSNGQLNSLLAEVSLGFKTQANFVMQKPPVDGLMVFVIAIIILNI
jgi:hypothetical protein